MGPVLKDIKEMFDNYKRNQTALSRTFDICARSPFSPRDFWMYHYLFPEVLLVADCLLSYPCCYFEEDEIMRIMAEHSLL